MKRKWNWKLWLAVLGSVFLLYLCMEYWPVAAGILGSAFSAAVPLFVGAVIAYIVNILMSFYERHYFPKGKKKFWTVTRRPVCLTVAFLTLAAIIAGVLWLIVPNLISCVKLLVAEVPGAVTKGMEWMEARGLLSGEIQELLSDLNWQDVWTKVGGWLTSGLGSMVDIVVQAVSSVFSGIVTAFIGFVFALYLLLSKENLKRQCNKVMDRYLNAGVAGKIRYVLSVLNDCFHKYIVGQCTEALVLGVLCLIGMLILRLPYATMISALVAFTALIPIAGAYIGAGVGAFMILTVSPLKALIFLIFIVVLQQLEGNLIYPKVVGSSLDLPAMWVLAAVTVGGGILGIPGMLIGVPITAALYKLARAAVNTPKPPKKEET